MFLSFLLCLINFFSSDLVIGYGTNSWYGVYKYEILVAKVDNDIVDWYLNWPINKSSFSGILYEKTENT